MLFVYSDYLIQQSPIHATINSPSLCSGEFSQYSIGYYYNDFLWNKEGVLLTKTAACRNSLNCYLNLNTLRSDDGALIVSVTGCPGAACNTVACTRKLRCL